MKRMGDKTPPCLTPFLTQKCCDQNTPCHTCFLSYVTIKYQAMKYKIYFFSVKKVFPSAPCQKLSW